MPGVLIRWGEAQKHMGRMWPWQQQLDWCIHLYVKETKDCWQIQKLEEEREDSPRQVQREQGPADTLFSSFYKPAFAVDTGWVRVTPGQLAMMRKIALTWEAGGGMWQGPGPPWSPGCLPISSQGLMAPSLARVHLPQERGLLP